MTTLSAPLAMSSASPVLPTPAQLTAGWPLPDAAATAVAAGRQEIAAALTSAEARLLVVVGPCSLHDPVAAHDYAAWLRGMTATYGERLHLVMRAYVEKPRTRLGWKGLVADPGLDGSDRVADGLRLARELLAAIAASGVALATEFITPMAAACLADLVTWSAVGARTVESPVHRELASWLPCPVGFKNTVGGDVAAAVNAMVAAGVAQTTMVCDDDGRIAARANRGNQAVHLILRGGARPNHGAATVHDAVARLRAERLPARVLVDCSHGNSSGDPSRQRVVVDDVAAQLAAGAPSLLGVMIESHLVAGAQRLVPGRPLVYGQSITDACLDLAQTEAALAVLFDAVAAGRRPAAPAPSDGALPSMSRPT